MGFDRLRLSAIAQFKKHVQKHAQNHKVKNKFKALSKTAALGDCGPSFSKKKLIKG
jgi:hypothetical protein